jgi:hypothetical protein
VPLTVSGFTIRGSVVACADLACATPQPLPGATVTLKGGSTLLTTNADASGNYSFANVALGTNTISVAGTDASNTHYVGNATVTVSDNTSNFAIQVYPG